jgi:Spy/CpxP family protein refolding chaperone
MEAKRDNLKTRRCAVVALVVGVALAGLNAPAAQAQERSGGKPGHRGTVMMDPSQFGEKLAQHLNLTQAQKDQIARLTETFKSQNADALARAEKVHQEVVASANDGSRPTREEIKAITERHGNPGQQLMPAMRQLREDVLDVLTPEQRQQLSQLREQFRHGRGEGRRGKQRRG